MDESDLLPQLLGKLPAEVLSKVVHACVLKIELVCMGERNPPFSDKCSK